MTIPVVSHNQKHIANMTLTDAIGAGANFIINFLMAVVSFFVTITGTGALLIADVAMGAMVLGQLFTTSVTAFGWTFTPETLGGMISLATSAVQMVIWKAFFDTKSYALKWVVLIPAVIIAVVDTLLDTSLTNVLVNGGDPIFLPQQKDTTFWLAWAVILLITGFNEALINVVGIVTGGGSTQIKQMSLRRNQNNRTYNNRIQNKNKDNQRNSRRR